jgi:hypothetical protein
MPHYNTTNQVDARLKQLNFRAGSQKEYIAKLFIEQADIHPDGMTTSEVADLVFDRKYGSPRKNEIIFILNSYDIRNRTISSETDVVRRTLLYNKNNENTYKRIIDLTDHYGHKRQRVIISVRRAITDLMNDGFLVKTSRKKKGYSDLENYLYKLK